MQKGFCFSKTPGGGLRPFMTILVVLFLCLGIQPLAIGQQTETVRGKVLDGKGSALGNTSVSVLGHSGGAISDSTGEFSIQAAKGDTLSFAHIGYGDLKVVGAENP